MSEDRCGNIGKGIKTQPSTVCRLIQLCPLASQMDYSDVPACRRDGPHGNCDDGGGQMPNQQSPSWELAPSGAGQEASFRNLRGVCSRTQEHSSSTGTQGRGMWGDTLEVAAHSLTKLTPGLDCMELPEVGSSWNGWRGPLRSAAATVPQIRCHRRLGRTMAIANRDTTIPTKRNPLSLEHQGS